MIVFMVLCGLLTLFSVCCSLYAVVVANNFERLRVNARDNEDELAKLSRDITSLRQSWGQRWKQLEERDEGNGPYDNLVVELLRQQLMPTNNTEDP